MTTHPGRLTQIITGMVEAFAGAETGSRDERIAKAVELVMATKPTAAELADAREALLDRHQDVLDMTPWASDDVRDVWVWERAEKAEALAIAEERLT